MLSTTSSERRGQCQSSIHDPCFLRIMLRYWWICMWNYTSITKKIMLPGRSSTICTAKQQALSSIDRKGRWLSLNSTQKNLKCAQQKQCLLKKTAWTCPVRSSLMQSQTDLNLHFDTQLLFLNIKYKVCPSYSHHICDPLNAYLGNAVGCPGKLSTNNRHFTKWMDIVLVM